LPLNFSQLSLGWEELNLFSVFVFPFINHDCSQVSARMFALNIEINEAPDNGNSSVVMSCVIFEICKSKGIKCPVKYDVNQGKAVNRHGKKNVY